MSKGRSYASDNQQQFEKGKQTFIHDDFVHQKALVFKGKLQNNENGFNIKQNIVERSEGVTQSGQVKFWMAVKDQRSFQVKMGTDTKINVQLDNGVRQLKQVKNNFYCGGQANRTFSQKLAFAGIQLFQDRKWSVNTKVSRDFSKGVTSLHNKFSLNWGEWRLNSYLTQDVTNFVMTKCGVLIGWAPENNWNYTLHFQNPKKTQKLSPAVILSNAFFNINRKISESQTVGFEANFNAFNLKNIFSQGFNVFNSVWLGSEWKMGQSTVKGRINKDLTSSFVVKNKIGEFGYYSLGLEASEIGSKNRFKFGVQVDLNL